MPEEWCNKAFNHYVRIPLFDHGLLAMIDSDHFTASTRPERNT